MVDPSRALKTESVSPFDRGDAGWWWAMLALCIAALAVAGFFVSRSWLLWLWACFAWTVACVAAGTVAAGWRRRGFLDKAGQILLRVSAARDGGPWFFGPWPILFAFVWVAVLCGFPGLGSIFLNPTASEFYGLTGYSLWAAALWNLFLRRLRYAAGTTLEIRQNGLTLDGDALVTWGKLTWWKAKSSPDKPAIVLGYARTVTKLWLTEEDLLVVQTMLKQHVPAVERAV